MPLDVFMNRAKDESLSAQQGYVLLFLLREKHVVHVKVAE